MISTAKMLRISPAESIWDGAGKENAAAAGMFYFTIIKIFSPSYLILADSCLTA